MAILLNQSWLARVHADILRSPDRKLELLAEEKERLSGAFVRIGGLIIPQTGINPVMLRLDYPYKRKGFAQWLKGSPNTVDATPISSFVGTFADLHLTGNEQDGLSLGINMTNTLTDDRARIIGTTFVYSAGLVDLNSQPLAKITIGIR